MTYPIAGDEVQVMSRIPEVPQRREFLKQGLALGLAVAAGQTVHPGQLFGSALDPDPEVPNEQVAQILKSLFGDRPIRRGQVTLDMPVVAEDGRVVPVIIEAPALPMTTTNYVKAVHLIKEKRFGRMVSYQSYHVGDVPIEDAVNKLRLVGPDSEEVLAARAIGISFGDK